MEPFKLTTVTKQKYGEVLIAIDNGPARFNAALFDACELFMQEDTWVERQRVQAEAKAFAERFVAQMNAAIPQPVA